MLQAEAFFADMPFPVWVHWTNGPAVKELLASLQEFNLEVMGPPGKGWAVWQGLGVATRQAEVVGLDADIHLQAACRRGCWPCWILRALPTSSRTAACRRTRAARPRNALFVNLFWSALSGCG